MGAATLRRSGRLIGPLLTLIAAGAGLLAGVRLAAPSSELSVIGSLLLVAVCAAAAWAVSGRGGEVLRTTGAEAFRAELDRARRHRRSFAMARLELVHPPADVIRDPDGDGIDSATIALIGASLRITDRAWLDDGDAIILLPESDRATAEAFAERVRKAAPGRFGSRIGLAVFPDDGMTSGALLDALERGIRGDARPAPIVNTTVSPVIVAGVVEVGGASPESGVG
jgi:hypothetical protein